MAVLVGLATSKCGNEINDFHSYDLCLETCEFPRVVNNRYVEGKCIRSSINKTKYKDSVVRYYYCWKCIAEPLD